jgi:hypothetical protein
MMKLISPSVYIKKKIDLHQFNKKLNVAMLLRSPASKNVDQIDRTSLQNSNYRTIINSDYNVAIMKGES